MSDVYRDKGGSPSAYRAVLMLRTVGVLMLAVAAIAAVFPQIDALMFSLVCLVLIVPALVYQIRLDNTLIHTGNAFVDDEAQLYVVVGSFNLGFGRSHHMRKQVMSYRVSCIQKVRSVKEYPFGIAVKAEVWTASSKQFELDEDDFDTPGLMLERLKAFGKKRTVRFRLERCLTEKDEKALLSRLQELSQRL